MTANPFRTRKLWPIDFPAYRRHLKSLDLETRQARFGASVSDAILGTYADSSHRLGTALKERIIATARNRGINRLHMICLQHNSRMLQLTGKFGAELRIEEGEVTGHIAPRSPTKFSVLEETMDGTQAFIIAVFDWSTAAAQEVSR